MNCIKCNAELKDGAKFCDACGSPQVATQVQPPPPQAPGSLPVPPGLPPRKLVTYRMLAFFLGSLGVHDFYAGYTIRGVIKLLLFLLGGLSWIWALVDIFTIKADACGRPMEDTVPKKILTYRLLAFFLGATGVHNIYAGYVGRGLAQLLLCWTGISTVWALIETFFVKKDANGNPMEEIGPKAEKVGNGFSIASVVLLVLAVLINIGTFHSLLHSDPSGIIFAVGAFCGLFSLVCMHKWLGGAGLLLSLVLFKILLYK